MTLNHDQLTAQAGHVRARGMHIEASSALRSAEKAMESAERELERTGAPVPEFTSESGQQLFGEARRLTAEASKARQAAA